MLNISIKYNMNGNTEILRKTFSPPLDESFRQPADRKRMTASRSMAMGLDHSYDNSPGLCQLGIEE